MYFEVIFFPSIRFIMLLLSICLTSVSLPLAIEEVVILQFTQELDCMLFHEFTWPDLINFILCQHS